MPFIRASRTTRPTAVLGPPPKHVLIVKVFGMGDSVLIRALIERIRNKYPETEIGVLVGPGTRELMTHGLSVRSHTYNQKHLTARAILAMRRDIRESRYEAIANFEQGSLAGTLFLDTVGAAVHAGFTTAGSDPKARFLTHPVTFRECDTMWQSFLRLARVLYPGLPDGIPSLELASSVASQNSAAEWWHTRVGEYDGRAVAMHLGCGPGMDFRRWPLDRFLELAERLRRQWKDLVIILTGTALEQNLIQEFRARFRGKAVDASDLGSIEGTALILKRCHLLISNDTGVMHLGAALGVPTVGLFGPNSPIHWAPLGKSATHVRETSVPCSPCINNYRNITPPDCTHAIRGKCMSDITVDSVQFAIADLLVSWNRVVEYRD